MTDEKCVRCGGDQLVEGPSSGTRRCVSSAKVPATSIAAPRSTPLPARLVGISTSISKAVPAARRSEIATEETAAVRNSGRRRTAFRALETPSPAASCRPCVLPPLSEASVRRQRRPVGEDHQRLWDIVANKMKVCQIWPPWTHVSPTRGWGCGLQDPSQESRCPMYNTPTTRRIEVTARSVEDRFDLRHRSVAVSGPAGSVLPPNQLWRSGFGKRPEPVAFPGPRPQLHTADTTKPAAATGSSERK
ncbi:hypothetical protein RN03_0674 [Mycobacterium tuberculosis]|nr:hypothetical protein RN03_0674 [Mycobacterium tuberculosis]